MFDPTRRMSAIRQASGGDGWTTWVVERSSGDYFTIVVYSKAESERQDTPSGWGPKILLEETMRDDIGRRAVDRAISFSSAYGARMAD